ncbi:hypothetical protein [Corynebacterium ulcerans]|uniref:hypothetical protein n=1 Tax=Corynebacterium ulcerans TaxID=65058 RepID=UPI0002141C1E|nr:hypothetical protein [Corynebacterium ulcerans]AEG81699.1 hypothetical protein CULC809_01166 [Corynebacterium ulcerans 809]AEG83891.1 hypothetical protein CULC22_01181 [Corynebacterium ulcerans BR-AD22]PLW01182.1 hypothetical protein BRL54_11435 [Corynebacterium ulcerans]
MLRVITGPPAAGKTTYLTQHAKQGDIRIDFDRIANLITGQPDDNHTHTHETTQLVRAGREAMRRQALKLADTCDIWLIHTKPTPKQLAEYKAANAEIITIDPGKQTVIQRCKNQRPPESLTAAYQWYEPTKPKSARQRGYTHHNHEIPRKRLLMALRDGTPCYWCGLPLHKDKTQNWDGLPLAADHYNPHGARNGEQPDSLLHFKCNSQRGDGSRDFTRPAITGRHPSQPLPKTPAMNKTEIKNEAFIWK